VTDDLRAPGASVPTDDRCRQVFNLLERAIEERWGIPVRIRDVPNPFTGDLDGAEIHVDHDLSAEDALFIVIHLFGHTVQWNVAPELRALGQLRGTGLPEETIAALVEYERQACRYSQQLLHECGVHDLDQWLADFSACDLAYLVHFYRHGEKLPFRSFWRGGQPTMVPAPIPPFQPTRWVARSEGVVI
jgi:hypothetical protein